MSVILQQRLDINDKYLKNIANVNKVSLPTEHSTLGILMKERYQYFSSPFFDWSISR